MTNRIFSKIWESCLVIFASLCATLFTTVSLIYQYLNKPKDSIFIGVSHYWEDFFYYLDQFYQGAHNHWLTVNNFTGEQTNPSFFYFYNILLGKIGGLFNLEPYISYNISLLILKFLFFLLSYFLLMNIFVKKSYRFFTFIIFLCSTSFPVLLSQEDGSLIISPVRLFRAKNLVFTRFENVPSTYIINIVFILSLLLLINYIYYSRKKYSRLLKQSDLKSIFKFSLPYAFFNTIILSLLTLGDSVKSFLLLVVFTIVIYIQRPKEKMFTYFLSHSLTFTILVIPTLLIFNILSSSLFYDDIYRQANLWDLNNHNAQLAYLFNHPYEFITSFGLFGFGIVIGIYALSKIKLTITMQFTLILFFLSTLLFFNPFSIILGVPGFRFKSTSNYLFGSIIVLYALIYIQKIINKPLLPLMIFIYFLINAFTFQSSFRNQMKPLAEPYNHFTYMPPSLYDGFRYFHNLPTSNFVILANPTTSMDILIPGLTGKKTYSGHLLMTYKSEEKDKQAVNFLYNKTDENLAYQFLKTNNIEYIFWTKYDGSSYFATDKYSFLDPVFTNDFVIIYHVD